MKRLFVLGCSFSRYHWPTWADIVGKEFDHFENWGNSGLGNRALIERLSELTLANSITKDDTIIVQWTDPNRFDLHMPNKFPEEPWFTGGNILNSPLYNQEWASYYWNPSSYAMHTYNFIHLATCLLNSLPCTWYFTSMNDMTDDLKYYPQFQIYSNILINDKWLPPIKPFFDNNYKTKWFKKPVRNNIGLVTHYVNVEDPHPTPVVHAEYAYNFLASLLNITIDKDWAKKADDLLDGISTHEDMRDTFIEKINWDNRANWVKGL